MRRRPSSQKSSGTAPGHVAAVAVDVEFPDEILHVPPQVFAQSGRSEIQLREMPMAVPDFPVFVADREIRMFREERRRRAAVVVDQVEQHAEPEAVGGADERFQVVIRAVFGIDRVVVADAVDVLRVVEPGLLLAVAPEFRARVVVGQRDRTEIDHIRPERGDVRQQPFRRPQRPVGRECAQIDLVDDRVLQEFRRGFCRQVRHFLSFPMVD